MSSHYSISQQYMNNVTNPGRTVTGFSFDQSNNSYDQHRPSSSHRRRSNPRSSRQTSLSQQQSLAEKNLKDAYGNFNASNNSSNTSNNVTQIRRKQNGGTGILADSGDEDEGQKDDNAGGDTIKTQSGDDHVSTKISRPTSAGRNGRQIQIDDSPVHVKSEHGTGWSELLCQRDTKTQNQSDINKNKESSGNESDHELKQIKTETKPNRVIAPLTEEQRKDSAFLAGLDSEAFQKELDARVEKRLIELGLKTSADSEISTLNVSKKGNDNVSDHVHKKEQESSDINNDINEVNNNDNTQSQENQISPAVAIALARAGKTSGVNSADNSLSINYNEGVTAGTGESSSNSTSCDIALGQQGLFSSSTTVVLNDSTVALTSTMNELSNSVVSVNNNDSLNSIVKEKVSTVFNTGKSRSNSPNKNNGNSNAKDTRPNAPNFSKRLTSNQTQTQTQKNSTTNNVNLNRISIWDRKIACQKERTVSRPQTPNIPGLQGSRPSSRPTFRSCISRPGSASQQQYQYCQGPDKILTKLSMTSPTGSNKQLETVTVNTVQNNVVQSPDNHNKGIKNIRSVSVSPVPSNRSNKSNRSNVSIKNFPPTKNDTGMPSGGQLQEKPIESSNSQQSQSDTFAQAPQQVNKISKIADDSRLLVETFQSFKSKSQTNSKPSLMTLSPRPPPPDTAKSSFSRPVSRSNVTSVTSLSRPKTPPKTSPKNDSHSGHVSTSKSQSRPKTPPSKNNSTKKLEVDASKVAGASGGGSSKKSSTKGKSMSVSNSSKKSKKSSGKKNNSNVIVSHRTSRSPRRDNQARNITVTNQNSSTQSQSKKSKFKNSNSSKTQYARNFGKTNQNCNDDPSHESNDYIGRTLPDSTSASESKAEYLHAKRRILINDDDDDAANLDNDNSNSVDHCQSSSSISHGNKEVIIINEEQFYSSDDQFSTGDNYDDRNDGDSCSVGSNSNGKFDEGDNNNDTPLKNSVHDAAVIVTDKVNQPVDNESISISKNANSNTPDHTVTDNDNNDNIVDDQTVPPIPKSISMVTNITARNSDEDFECTPKSNFNDTITVGRSIDSDPIRQIAFAKSLEKLEEKRRGENSSCN